MTTLGREEIDRLIDTKRVIAIALNEQGVCLSLQCGPEMRFRHVWETCAQFVKSSTGPPRCLWAVRENPSGFMARAKDIVASEIMPRAADPVWSFVSPWPNFDTGSLSFLFMAEIPVSCHPCMYTLLGGAVAVGGGRVASSSSGASSAAMNRDVDALVDAVAVDQQGAAAGAKAPSGTGAAPAAPAFMLDSDMDASSVQPPPKTSILHLMKSRSASATGTAQRSASKDAKDQQLSAVMSEAASSKASGKEAKDDKSAVEGTTKLGTSAPPAAAAAAKGAAPMDESDNVDQGAPMDMDMHMESSAEPPVVQPASQQRPVLGRTSRGGAAGLASLLERMAATYSNKAPAVAPRQQGATGVTAATTIMGGRKRKRAECNRDHDDHSEDDESPPLSLPAARPRRPPAADALSVPTKPAAASAAAAAATSAFGSGPLALVPLPRGVEPLTCAEYTALQATCGFQSLSARALMTLTKTAHSLVPPSTVWLIVRKAPRYSSMLGNVMDSTIAPFFIVESDPILQSTNEYGRGQLVAYNHATRLYAKSSKASMTFFVADVMGTIAKLPHMFESVPSKSASAGAGAGAASAASSSTTKPPMRDLRELTHEHFVNFIIQRFLDCGSKYVEPAQRRAFAGSDIPPLEPVPVLGAFFPDRTRPTEQMTRSDMLKAAAVSSAAAAAARVSTYCDVDSASSTDSSAAGASAGGRSSMVNRVRLDNMSKTAKKKVSWDGDDKELSALASKIGASSADTVRPNLAAGSGSGAGADSGSSSVIVNSSLQPKKIVSAARVIKSPFR